MVESFNSIEELVQQTFELANATESVFEQDHNTIKDQQIQLIDSKNLKNTPGLLYRIKNSSFTFCIISKCFKSIEENIKNNENEQFYLDFLYQDEPQDFNYFLELLGKEIFVFYSQFYTMSEIIYENINKRRFPLREDMVFNISDPSLGWWFHESDNFFELQYRTPICSNKNYLNLGPVGDHFLFFNLINKWEKLLLDQFGIKVNVHSSFKVTFEDKSHSKLFDEIKTLLKTGEVNFTSYFFEQETLDQFNKSFLIFLQELACVRVFWRNIQAKLKKFENNIIN